MKIELLGNTSREELERRIQKVAAAGKLSRFKGDIFQTIESCNDYEKNEKLIERIIKMGHKSITEHDYLVFAIKDCTIIIEHLIIGYRLTSFTIKSRREVDFRKEGFYVPKFRNKKGEAHEKQAELMEEFTNHCTKLFNAYGDIVDEGIKVEDARFLLPYSYHCNIMMGLDARELESMIIAFKYGPLSKITEVKEFGEKLYDIVKKYVPYLVPNIERQKTNTQNSFEYLESNEKRPDIKIVDKPKLISCTPNADDVILASSIMYHYQCSQDEAYRILEDMEKKDKNARTKLMKNIVHKPERRELEQVTYSFQIPISLSILTHLTRHRMHSLLIPEFTPLWNLENYVTPASIKANEKTNKIFQKFVKENIELCNKFKEEGVMDEDLVYFYLGAQMLNTVTTINGRIIQWMARMRCCNKAQWQIRYIFQEIVKLVKETAPLLGENLGATCMTDRYCNEGRESCGLIDKLLELDQEKAEENNN